MAYGRLDTPPSSREKCFLISGRKPLPHYSQWIGDVLDLLISLNKAAYERIEVRAPCKKIYNDLPQDHRDLVGLPHLYSRCWKIKFSLKNLHAVRFELTSVATSELESDPLDHSGTHAIRPSVNLNQSSHQLISAGNLNDPNFKMFPNLITFTHLNCDKLVFGHFEYARKSLSPCKRDHRLLQ